CFIAMEYLEGQPLDRVVAAAARAPRPVPAAVWLRIVADALLGLGHAHTLADYDGKPLEIVHRDVSPQNIFVTYAGVVKIVGFGIAKAALNEVGTETGVLKGKLAYMAPEQASLEGLDQRADLFAMGVVLWELLAGRRMRDSQVVRALHELV